MTYVHILQLAGLLGVSVYGGGGELYHLAAQSCADPCIYTFPVDRARVDYAVAWYGEGFGDEVGIKSRNVRCGPHRCVIYRGPKVEYQ
jgi:hypothetical protein